MENRICYVCKIEKSITEFYRKLSKHSYMCKTCQNIYTKEYYLKHRPKYIEKSRERRKRKYQEFKIFKASLKCERCDECHPSCLDFHHLDPKIKKFRIANGFDFSKKYLQEELDKCIVLCANCHRKEHFSVKVNDKTDIQ